MTAGGKLFAEAIREDAFEFLVRDYQAQYRLKGTVMFRSFQIGDRAGTVGVIRPDYLFSRRATVDCDKGLDETTQIFCFWLVALCWRRR